MDEEADVGQGHEEERRPPDLNNQIFLFNPLVNNIPITTERLSYQDVASRQFPFLITYYIIIALLHHRSETTREPLHLATGAFDSDHVQKGNHFGICLTEIPHHLLITSQKKFSFVTSLPVSSRPTFLARMGS